ncbi:TIGR02281 family clan AA aspartic protease [Flavobacterium sp. RHBU_3]|uniref:retropepsin-like aspartic protease family protein n=1 Tax=Flavobacterium sp. RHBU_3 TaxID=3391184 RepID=UPI0039853A70
MKRSLLAIAVLFLAISCKTTQVKSSSLSNEYKIVDSLISEKSYFKARDILKKQGGTFSEYQRLLSGAAIDNAFNEPAASNNKISMLFAKYYGTLTDSMRLNLLRIKASNHARLFQYTDAEAATARILKEYPFLMRADEVTDYQNSLEIWQSLSGQPKQEVTVNGDIYIKLQRDKAGLKNLTVKRDSISIPFIFDTGANLSAVNESTAARMGMTILDSAIDVGAITGNVVEAKLAVCPVFTIGNITVKNAVFLVFPDSGMSFPQIDYKINGIIGFPVIEALGEVQITAADEFIVPQKSTAYSKRNMTLEFLTPIIDVEGEYFTFDTGAASTMLYRKYYLAHPEVYKGLDAVELNSGGVGGTVKRKGYNITFSPVIDGRQLHIDKVDLFQDDTNADLRFFYGNMGQDVIKQFSKMTINFRDMFIKFD